MTPEEKGANVALLAEKVMRWTLEPLRDGFRAKLPDGNMLCIGRAGSILREWDPYASIADAMEMLEKFRWTLESTSIGYYFMLDYEDGPSARSADVREAICAACVEWARAQGERG